MNTENDNEFNSEVYDEGDIASALEMQYLNKALEKQKEKMKPETHPDFDGLHCIDCDDDIPEERLKMNKIRCVLCQEILEKKIKRNSK